MALRPTPSLPCSVSLPRRACPDALSLRCVRPRPGLSAGPLGRAAPESVVEGREAPRPLREPPGALRSRLAAGPVGAVRAGGEDLREPARGRGVERLGEEPLLELLDGLVAPVEPDQEIRSRASQPASLRRAEVFAILEAARVERERLLGRRLRLHRGQAGDRLRLARLDLERPLEGRSGGPRIAQRRMDLA